MSVVSLIVHQELQADRYPKASFGFAVSFASARQLPQAGNSAIHPKGVNHDPAAPKGKAALLWPGDGYALR